MFSMFMHKDEIELTNLTASVKEMTRMCTSRTTVKTHFNSIK